jgi:RimJ/RimL family protein N-acetyltransferase
MRSGARGLQRLVALFDLRRRQSVARRRTARLSLRSLSSRDLAALTAMHQDPDVMATLGGLRSPVETERFVDETVRHWEQHGFGLWVAHELAGGSFVGRGGLRRVEMAGRSEVEVAYALLPPFWGRGLASELARESIRVAFSELGLPEVVAFTQVRNRASQRVLDKVGFRFEREFERAGEPHWLFRLRRGEEPPSGPPWGSTRLT